MTDVKLTDVGIVQKLREDYGIQATTASDDNPSNPNQSPTTIAVQQAVPAPHGDDTDFEEFLADQGLEQEEHLGRGLFVWQR